MQERARAISRVSLLALLGNALLAGAKITIGLWTHSLAVLGDGLDSTTDVLICIITLAVSRYIAKPSDHHHPYGHGRAETLATNLLAFFIFFAGGQLLVYAVQNLLAPIPRGIPGHWALLVTGLSILGKLILSWLLDSAGHRYDSDMLKANGKNMRGDVFLSAAVLVGLFCSAILKKPILDPVVALLIALWIIKTALGIFLEVNMELMDGNQNTDLYRELFDGVKSVSGAGNPHRARIRKIANRYSIDLDIEVDPSLSVKEAHDIAVEVEQAIRCRIENVYDVMIHVEPEGNLEEDEVFGLSEDNYGCEEIENNGK